MTLADLKETCKGVFFPSPVYKIEVRWKSGTHKPKEIVSEECSEVLRQLDQRGGIDQLALYYYDEVPVSAESEASWGHPMIF